MHERHWFFSITLWKAGEKIELNEVSLCLASGFVTGKEI